MHPIGGWKGKRVCRKELVCTPSEKLWTAQKTGLILGGKGWGQGGIRKGTDQQQIKVVGIFI